MPIKTTAIIIKNTRYNDSACIVQAYSEHSGLISFIANGVYSRKPKFNATLFHNLNVAELVLSDNERGSLMRLTEIRSVEPLINIQTHIVKSTIAQFVTEIIAKTTREGIVDDAIFQFLKHSILLLEHSNKSIVNFHIVFMCLYSKCLGIYPINNRSEACRYYNYTISQFIESHCTNCFSEIESALFSESLEYNFNNLENIELDNLSRRKLLHLWIKIYERNFENFRNLKSLDILSDIFS